MPRAERGSPITEEMSTGRPSAHIAPIPRMRRLMMQSPGHNQGTDLPPLDLAPYSGEQVRFALAAWPVRAAEEQRSASEVSIG
jgi:hypothetical protein